MSHPGQEIKGSCRKMIPLIRDIPQYPVACERRRRGYPAAPYNQRYGDPGGRRSAKLTGRQEIEALAPCAYPQIQATPPSTHSKTPPIRWHREII